MSAQSNPTNFIDVLDAPQHASSPYAAFPEELRRDDVRAWVLWKLEKRNGKMTKVPYDAETGQPAEADNPETWTTFAHAMAVFEANRKRYNGIGIQLGGVPQLIGIDLDGMAPGGAPNPYATQILKILGGYAESSPNGNGLHIFVYSATPLNSGNKFNGKGDHYGAEIYDATRYLTVTGNPIPGSSSTVPHVDDISLAYFLLQQVKNPKFEKFQKLWTGDCSDKNGDESSADEALMCWLARELKKDVAKMEQYFSASVLGQREKWQRKDYRERTIKFAMDNTTVDYPKVGDEPATKQLRFRLPAVPFKFPRDYAIAPAQGQKIGWFPSNGSPSIIAGPSAGGKTTWMYQLLTTQIYNKQFHGHETYGYPFITFGRDRGLGDHLETMERMRLSPALVPFVPLAHDVYDFDAAQAILKAIEDTVPMPKIVFIEGIDMMVERGNELRPSTDFMHWLQQISERYNLVIIGSMGSPKVKEGNGYAATRDNILGSTGWGRAAATVALFQFSKKKNEKGRRTLTVELRNAPTEKFVLLFVDGLLEVQPDVPDEEESSSEQAKDSQYFDWYEARERRAEKEPKKKWWTVGDVERELHVSAATAARNVKEHWTHDYIIKKTGGKQGMRGKAIQYRWNDKESNPIVAERQKHQQEEPEPVF